MAEPQQFAFIYTAERDPEPKAIRVLWDHEFPFATPVRVLNRDLAAKLRGMVGVFDEVPPTGAMPFAALVSAPASPEREAKNAEEARLRVLAALQADHEQKQKQAAAQPRAQGSKTS